jgi:hypothetical protein
VRVKPGLAIETAVVVVVVVVVVEASPVVFPSRR